MKRDILIDIAAILYVLLFVYAAISKWIDFDAFVQSINAQPFDDKYTYFIVYALPTTELVIAGMIIHPKTFMVGMYMATGIMALFTGYILLIKANFYAGIPCSCGGVTSKLNWTQHLYFNLFFLLLAVIGIYFKKRPPYKQKEQQVAIS